jgi:hypothetical protein
MSMWLFTNLQKGQFRFTLLDLTQIKNDSTQEWIKKSYFSNFDKSSMFKN